MTPEQFRAVRRLFDELRGVPTPEWVQRLQVACPDDAAVQAEVLELLRRAAAESAGGMTPGVSECAGGSASPNELRLADRVLGTQVGPYRVRSVLGVGGMGTVYEAEHERSRQVVALKLIRPGLATPALLRRFEFELQVLARLEHPGIARIYHADTADIGGGPQPYFAMELVRGRNLLAYAGEEKLTLRAKLELASRIADAVQYAHQQGVIHRDLKPGNIFVAADGQPKILDFGVARATDSDVQSTTLQSDIGQLIGTLPYMSPEQAGGNPLQIDTRSDVYALGVVIYELLTGRLPYLLKQRLIHEAVRIIREEEPTRLSSINRTLRGDVETIVGKALEKDKSRRYPTANALAADLRRYLADEPIAARPPSATYQMTKFARRNKVLVGGVIGTLLALAAGLFVSTFYYFRADAARKAESEALTLALRNQDLANQRSSEARAAQEAERARANELERIVDFQRGQLAGMDVRKMGAGLRKDLLDGVRLVAQRMSESPEATESKISAIESLLDGADFTGIARKALEQNIFGNALATIHGEFGDQPLLKARLLQTVANTLRELGFLEMATPPQEEALAIRRRDLGNDDSETLSSIDNMGHLLLMKAQFREAELYCQEALDGRRRLFGNEHPHTCTSIGNLGLAFELAGRFVDAETMYREALSVARKVYGDEHRDTIVCMANLAHLLATKAQFAEAIQTYRDAIDVSRRQFGAEDEPTISLLHKLGWILAQSGDRAAAEPVIREALAASRVKWGDDHPTTIAILSNLGTTLSRQARFIEAESCLRAAHRAARNTYGEFHPETLSVLGNLATLLDDVGRRDEAEAIFTDIVTKRRASQGVEHPDTLHSMSVLALILIGRGRLQEAESYCRQVLESRRRIFGESHPDTISAISNMAYVLGSQGRYIEGEPYYREALEKQRTALGEMHPETLTALNNVGFMLNALGRVSEAEVCYRDCMDKRTQKLGSEHPLTLQSVSNLALLYESQGRLDEAERMLRDVLKRRQLALGDAHVDSLASTIRLASLIARRGQPREAIELLAPAEPRARQTFGKADIRMLGMYLATLGRCRISLGEWSLAESNLREASQVFESAENPSQSGREAVLTGMRELYTAWHAAEPDKGHDVKAARWTAKLDAWRASTQPATRPAATSRSSTGEGR